MRRTATLVSALVMMLVTLGMAAPAQATLLLAIDVSGEQACAADNNVGCTFGTVLQDLDPAVGVLQVGNVTVGGLEVTGTTQIAQVGTTEGTFNVLNTSSLQATNVTDGTLTGSIAVSATDFTPPAFQAFVSGSSNWETAQGSSIAMQWYNDPLNGQGAETATDTPGDLLATCTDNITLPADSTACSDGPFAVNDPNPFSMTLFTSFTLVSGGTVVNRGQTELKPVGVPEPASLAVLGVGLLGVGYKLRRR